MKPAVEFEEGFAVIIRGIVSRPSLNECCGEVIRVLDDRCGVFIKKTGATISIKKSNLILQCEVSQAAIRAVAPTSFSAFVDGVIAGTETHWLRHRHARDISAWASDADIAAVLRGAQPGALVDAMATAALCCVQVCDKQFGSAFPIRILDCAGCNTVYAAHSHPGEGPPKVRFAVHDGAPFVGCVHRVSLQMELLSSLLRSSSASDADALLDCLAPEAPKGVESHQAWIHEQMFAGRCFATTSLLGIIDHCQGPLPKFANVAASLLGLVISLRPATVMTAIDPEPLAQMLFRYLGAIFGRIKHTTCLVEQTFGVSELVNVIPLLYHLGDWAHSNVALPRHNLPASLGSLSINMLHQVNQDGLVWDKPLDVERFPELESARCTASVLFGDAGLQLLTSRPYTFALAALIEIQGRWAHRKVDVSSARCPSVPLPDVAERMTSEQIANHTACVGEMWREYLPNLDEWIAGAPEVAFTRPIVAALMSGKRPPLPTRDESLLRGPLHACMTCSYPGCTRTTQQLDSEKPLLACAGGCDGLARYCCKNHQRSHWAQHKSFCRYQQKIKDDPEYARMVAKAGGLLSIEEAQGMRRDFNERVAAAAAAATDQSGGGGGGGGEGCKEIPKK